MFLLKVTMQPLRRPYTVRRPLQDVCRPLKLIKHELSGFHRPGFGTNHSGSTVLVHFIMKIPLVMKGSEKGRLVPLVSELSATKIIILFENNPLVSELSANQLFVNKIIGL